MGVLTLGAYTDIAVQRPHGLPTNRQQSLPAPEHPEYPTVQVHVILRIILGIEPEVGHFGKPGPGVNKDSNQGRVPPGLEVITFVTAGQERF
jgi:hypothetical protein